MGFRLWTLASEKDKTKKKNGWKKALGYGLRRREEKEKKFKFHPHAGTSNAKCKMEERESLWPECKVEGEETVPGSLFVVRSR